MNETNGGAECEWFTARECESTCAAVDERVSYVGGRFVWSSFDVDVFDRKIIAGGSEVCS